MIFQSIPFYKIKHRYSFLRPISIRYQLLVTYSCVYNLYIYTYIQETKTVRIKIRKKREDLTPPPSEKVLWTFWCVTHSDRYYIYSLLETRSSRSKP